MFGSDRRKVDGRISLTVVPFADQKLRPGIVLLRQAYRYAADAHADPWDFALERDKLYEAGLTINDLRWLIAKGLAEHGLETSVYGDRHRSFRFSDGYNFEDTTAFVLTRHGVCFADHFLKEPAESPSPTEVTPVARPAEAAPRSPDPIANQTGDPPSALRPSWDATRRELRLAEELVKRFRVPAPNQETILTVFEEEGWPDHIDDPLPISHRIDPRTRLHDAINRLNGRQANFLIRFHGNGNGNGIYWAIRQSGMLRA